MKTNALLFVTIALVAVSFTEAGCRKKFDVGILFDGSKRVRETNFDEAKRIITTLAIYLNVSPVGSRMGIITYSDEVNVALRFNDPDTRHYSVLEKIQKIGFPGGFKARSERAINNASTIFFGDKGRGNRPNVPDMMLLFTAGTNINGLKSLVQSAMRRPSLKDVVILALGINRSMPPTRPLVVEEITDGKRKNYAINGKGRPAIQRGLGRILKNICERY